MINKNNKSQCLQGAYFMGGIVLSVLYIQYYLTLLSPQPYELDTVDVPNRSIKLRLREDKKHVQVHTAGK